MHFIFFFANVFKGGKMEAQIITKKKIIIVKQITLKALNKLESLGYSVFIVGGKA